LPDALGVIALDALLVVLQLGALAQIEVAKALGLGLQRRHFVDRSGWVGRNAALGIGSLGVVVG
jgi:hypothetical protein